MNGKTLLDALGQIDDRYVAEAEYQHIKVRRPIPWKPIAAAAACVVLMVGLYRTPPRELPPPESTEPAGITAFSKGGSKALSAGSELLVIRVNEMTETGFLGTVARSDAFGRGTELKVVFTDRVRAQGDLTGETVVVRYLEYDKETATILVDDIRDWKG